ncbi:unnamed protein product [Diplocarpon coronariae]
MGRSTTEDSLFSLPVCRGLVPSCRPLGSITSALIHGPDQRLVRSAVPAGSVPLVGASIQDLARLRGSPTVVLLQRYGTADAALVTYSHHAEGDAGSVLVMAEIAQITETIQIEMGHLR